MKVNSTVTTKNKPRQAVVPISKPKSITVTTSKTKSYQELFGNQKIACTVMVYSDTVYRKYRMGASEIVDTLTMEEYTEMQRRKLI